jgi:predicted cupin superfamily sugar epimerase
MIADGIIDHLSLTPHPEGGYCRRTWQAGNTGRPTGTCICFLLKAGERSHWHKVDATEVWHYHCGSPLILSISATSARPAEASVLGPDVLNEQAPQIIVPADHWQSAATTGDWTLVSCTVSPGFQFSGFTLAEPGFDIP